MKLFDDRGDAGRQLAQRLAQLSGKAVVVLGLPRGGVPVAFEVAKSLQAPLDVLVVRKLGVPFQPELAFGAIGEDGVRVLNDDVVRGTHLDAAAMDAVERKQLIELQRRAERFRRGRDRIPLTGRIAVTSMTASPPERAASGVPGRPGARCGQGGAGGPDRPRRHRGEIRRVRR